jgi:hypothetical protein
MGALPRPGASTMPEDEQALLFDLPPTTAESLWKGMPRFEQADLTSYQSVQVHFANEADRAAFAALVGQPISPLTRSLWYPKAAIGRYADKQFRTAAPCAPRYPIYIISKGRWESRKTAKALDAIGVPYHIVVEPQEYFQYAGVIAPEKILTLPFSNLGQGSIPARNWVWEHALETGAARHWILDDNIEGFYRLVDNLKTPVGDGTIFRAAEDFSDRYTNVAESGFNYFMFASRKTVMPPLTLNTRIYSCILLRNDLPFRWRGRYNEDTDLSIRLLKAGHCTVLFNAFLCGKSQTMSMKGGNTDQRYKDNGRQLMADSLREQHPDCVIVTEKWGRPQHHVDYSHFKRNALVPRPDLMLAPGDDDYGMTLHIDAPEAEV